MKKIEAKESGARDWRCALVPDCIAAASRTELESRPRRRCSVAVCMSLGTFLDRTGLRGSNTAAEASMAHDYPENYLSEARGRGRREGHQWLEFAIVGSPHSRQGRSSSLARFSASAVPGNLCHLVLNCQLLHADSLTINRTGASDGYRPLKISDSRKLHTPFLSFLSRYY
jgi:hypothetical protein